MDVALQGPNKSPTSKPKRLTFYGFGLDRGPDNIKLSGMCRQDLTSVVNVMFWIVWCFSHGCHLGVKCVLKVLDNWQWGSDSNVEPQQKYFSSVATICNVWRSAGAARKIQVEIERVYNPAIARHVAKKIPGRCLRGRWGSIDSVVGIFFWGMAVLATVFMRLFYKDAKAESKSKTPALGRGSGKI